MALQWDEGLALTDGVADDTREQPCLHLHPAGGEQSQWTQELVDAFDLAREAQQQVLLHRQPHAARGSPAYKSVTPPPPPAPDAHCVRR